MMIAAERNITLAHTGLSVAIKEFRRQQVGVEASATKMRVLALHGWLDNLASFDGLAALLCGNADQVNLSSLVTVDLPGHGHSEHKQRGLPYHFVDTIEDVYYIVEALGWKNKDAPTAVIGHSLGGAIALVTAATFPELFTKVVCIDTLGPLSSQEREVPGLLAPSVKTLQILASKAEKVYPSINECIAARANSDIVRMTLESARIICERGTRPHGEGVVFTHDKRLLCPSRFRYTESQVLGLLRSISVPVLFLRATEGITYDSKHATFVAERLAALEHTSHVVNVPGTHHVHLDTPAVVLPSVCDFLFRDNSTQPRADDDTNAEFVF
eukprot:gnl/Spiro4/25256_TR12572_c0_g1_i1.p1 gnl/Spiro4/25256_TR12572_c0_g1~~gnl/Spiro4/25256_TR12572_c0_g1_i1.p1  ORF type:complete len:344 (-),score=90.12 gnl/Spiro4/25256_TR12572_c0_g1_i1:18-1001(-)